MKIGNYFVHFRVIKLWKGEFSLGLYTCESEDITGTEFNSINLGLGLVEFGLFMKKYEKTCSLR